MGDQINNLSVPLYRALVRPGDPREETSSPTKCYIDVTMGDQINNLSVPLYRALVKAGASERRRLLHQQTATTYEILDTVDNTLQFRKQYIIYTCGSSYEGSVTPDLTSDVDVVVCHAFLPVVLDVAAAPPGESFLMVRDNWTPPGYCKLQDVEDGELMYDRHMLDPEYVGIDREGRACSKHVKGSNMQGPADMGVDEDGFHYLDAVPALKCDSIPPSDLRWIMRPRPYNFPSREQLQTMSRLGFTVVGVGHVKSIERDIEWRMSYTLQERILMQSLNATQHKTYILLKMIKKNIFRDHFNEESLSSYHFKTCLLYAVQMTPVRAWTPFNLVNCLLQCLKLMDRWLRAGHCPSFWTKDQNLFTKEGFDRARPRLLEVMRFIFNGGRQFLYMLHSDNIGAMLRHGDYRMFRAVRIKKKNEHIFNLKEGQIRGINYKVVSMIQNMSGGRLDPFYLANVLAIAKRECQISGHTVDETHSALEHVFPWLHLHIGNGLASAALTCPDVATKARLERAADFHLHEARGTDLVTSRLARATSLYASGEYEECCILLQLLENDFTNRVMLYCPCTHENVTIFYDEHECYRKHKHMSVHHMIRSHTTCCVVFLPSAAAIVPEPLTYEMQRSASTPPGSRDEKKDFWFDWAAVDARSYLYFLQYLVYTKLQRDVYKQVARDNLRAEILTDDRRVAAGGPTRVFHKETACNLLGWIYMQEGRFDDALSFFVRSLNIRNLHNAAKLHMRDWITMTSARR